MASSSAALLICFAAREIKITVQIFSRASTTRDIPINTKRIFVVANGFITSKTPRTALARALAYQPSFIMMDEPFAALDYFTRSQMQEELLRVQKERGASILFVTHSIEEALLLGDKIVIIDGGVVKAEFEVKEHNEELRNRILQQLDL